MSGAQVPPGRRVLFLSANPEAPSFRYRLAPVVPRLADMGYGCDIRVLPERRYGWRIWTLRDDLHACDAAVLHKLRLTAWEVRWLQRLCPATVFDVDDAIWLRQPKFVGHGRPASPRRLRSFEATCSTVSLTLAGNQMLADKAGAAGGRVQIVPTPVDVAAYASPDPARPAGRVVVWVGMPGNLQYLVPLRPVLSRLSRRYPGLTLRVISSDWPDWDDVKIERVAWSAAAEKTALTSADIGVMPLSDDEFARGKCAFKLLQYMAAALPCVASPVGANREVVVEGVTGLLADSGPEWEHALDRLLADPAAARRMGLSGHERASADYDMRRISARTAGLVDRLATSAR